MSANVSVADYLTPLYSGGWPIETGASYRVTWRHVTRYDAWSFCLFFVVFFATQLFNFLTSYDVIWRHFSVSMGQPPLYFKNILMAF